MEIIRSGFVDTDSSASHCSPYSILVSTQVHSWSHNPSKIRVVDTVLAFSNIEDIHTFFSTYHLLLFSHLHLYSLTFPTPKVSSFNPFLLHLLTSRPRPNFYFHRKISLKNLSILLWRLKDSPWNPSRPIWKGSSRVGKTVSWFLLLISVLRMRLSNLYPSDLHLLTPFLDSLACRTVFGRARMNSIQSIQ